MRYTPPLFRPPSEGRSYILQATLGCSWNNCTYCHMYRSKEFQVRPLADALADIHDAGRAFGPRVEKVFVADGDALILPLDHWVPILEACRTHFPRLRQVSCYAMATNILEKTPAELERLRALGLTLLYIGPESGDEVTLRRLAKQPRPAGVTRDEDYLFRSHADAAQKAREAGMKVSAIFLLGAGGVERSAAHAEGSARLATAMDPDYLAALTLTVVPGTPLARTMDRRGWALPDIYGLLGELRTFVDQARPTDALFRTNHASNYLPLGGRLPRDRRKIVDVIDLALDGAIPLRPEEARGL
ncbi:MAG: radical SAM protein [Alphaproteobacteria bacterium]|nr:radical SAM protein [Alphaproteobacteria bacterium]